MGSVAPVYVGYYLEAVLSLARFRVGANTVEWMEVHLISLNVQQETNAPLGKVSEREVRQRIIRDLHR